MRTPSSGLVAGQIRAEALARFMDAYAEVWNSAALERIAGWRVLGDVVHA